MNSHVSWTSRTAVIIRLVKELSFELLYFELLFKGFDENFAFKSATFNILLKQLKG